MRRLLTYLGVVSAGALSVFAFAPFNFFVAAWLSLATLFYLAKEARTSQALALGYCYGLGYFGAGVSWIQVSAHQFGVPLYTFSISVTVVFVAYLALFPALAMCIVSLAIKPYRPVFRLIGMVASFVGLEMIRGVMLTGFPWQALGYSLVDSPFSGILAIGGTHGASVFVAAVAALTASLVVGTSARWRFISGGLCITVLVIAYLVAQISFVNPTGQSLKVAVVQGNIPQNKKWLASERPKTIRRYFDLSQRALDDDLVIWPETAIPAFIDEVPDVLDTITTAANTSDTTFLIGIPRREALSSEVPSNGSRRRYFNSVIALGAEPGQYDKRHLVPFGEYLPLRFLLYQPLRAMHVRIADFVSGDKQQELVRVDGIPLGISICYEDVFSREVLRAIPRAEVLVNVSNDAWFGNSLAPHQHMQIAQARAIESGRYMIRATNTGISAIADHRGVLTRRSTQFAQEVMRGEVPAYTGTTPYARFGDVPVIAFILVTAVLVSRAARQTL